VLIEIWKIWICRRRLSRNRHPTEIQCFHQIIAHCRLWARSLNWESQGSTLHCVDSSLLLGFDRCFSFGLIGDLTYWFGTVQQPYGFFCVCPEVRMQPGTTRIVANAKPLCPVPYMGATRLTKAAVLLVILVAPPSPSAAQVTDAVRAVIAAFD